MEFEAVVFIESEPFARYIQRHGLEGLLSMLQDELMEDPTLGAVDPETGGLRKARMADPARGIGKRGGFRVHYLWLPRRRHIHFMSIYSKRRQGALSPVEKRALRRLVEAFESLPSHTT